MDAGREGGREETGRGGGEIWLSVEPLDSKSRILGVPDFNLEEDQREKRDGISMAAATFYQRERNVLKKVFGEKCAWSEEKGDEGMTQ